MTSVASHRSRVLFVFGRIPEEFVPPPHSCHHPWIALGSNSVRLHLMLSGRPPQVGDLLQACYIRSTSIPLPFQTLLLYFVFFLLLFYLKAGLSILRFFKLYSSYVFPSRAL